MKRARDFENAQDFVHYLVKREKTFVIIGFTASGLLITLAVLLGTLGTL